MIYQSLVYPHRGPSPGYAEEVAPGVQWIRLPLPDKLDHVNVWALDEGESWSLIDTGAHTEDTLAAWAAITKRAPMDRPLSRVFVTHMHPDHIGMAGWLTRRHGVELWISALEYLTCRALVGDMGREASAGALRFYREAGWESHALEAYRAQVSAMGTRIHPLPDCYRRLKDGQAVRIGPNSWEVVGGNGHSPEHACFYCAELKLLISGDQILPRISSNVSVLPFEPEADPMSDWLASLEKLKFRVPDDVLVLPAHHDCFHGLHARIDQLREEQEKALDRLREVLHHPCRVVEVFGALFGKPVSQSNGQQLRMATGEAVANLNHLRRRGEVRKELGDDGVAFYRMA